MRLVVVFVHLAGGMHDEHARHSVDCTGRRAHLAAALEAEVDFGCVGVTMIGADLARFPARHRHVACAGAVEDLLDMALRVPFLLPRQIKNTHETAPVASSSNRFFRSHALPALTIRLSPSIREAIASRLMGNWGSADAAEAEMSGYRN